MRRSCAVRLALTVGLLALPTTALCGPRLDEILNCLVLDAHTQARDDARFCTIEPDKPVGQTFVTGDDVQNVFRLAIWQAFWHETWQPDEAVDMPLPFHRAGGACRSS